jgi:hypothetical protein
VGAGIIGEAGGLKKGVPRKPDTCILGEELIARPAGLLWKDPAEGDAFVVSPDAKDETPVAEARFPDGNGGLIIPVIDAAVPAYRQGIAVDAFPIRGPDPHPTSEEGSGAGGLFKYQVERGALDEEDAFICDAIDGKAVS